jgi:serine/threonine-protein kinase RsbW
MIGGTMSGETAAKSESRLTIESRLDDLALLWPWIESLSTEYAVPADTQFAICLCLEEALSNVIRHGYHDRPGQPITIECAPGQGDLAFTVEDQAPAFNPLTAAENAAAAPPASIADFPLGGRGIRLMRKFAGSLAYQQRPGGNRLTMRFTVQG